MEKLVLKGTSFEAGKTHGIAAREKIQKLLASTDCARIRDEKKSFVTATWHYLEKHFAEILDELRGLAEGAGITPEQAFFLTAGNSFAELPAPHQCSAVAWRNSREGIVLFKTDDGPGFPPGDTEENVTHRRLGSKAVFDTAIGRGHRVMGVGEAGRLWIEVGFNDKGLCMGHTSGRPVLGAQDGRGIPQHLFPALVLRYCATCGEAVEFAKKYPVSGKGVNIVVADIKGGLAAIEKCARHTGRRNSREAVYVVNHYLNPAMFNEIHSQAPDFLKSDYYANSSSRSVFLAARLSRMARMNGGSSAEQLAVLLEHESGCICQHGMKDAGLWTNYAAFIQPASRSMEVFIGLPCRQAKERWILE